MLLAIDPSVRSPGAALFWQYRLRAAGRVRLNARATGVPDGAWWLDVARMIIKWAEAHGAGVLDPIRTVVFERPQIYRAFKSKGDPNDLIGLAGVGSAVAALAYARWSIAGVASPSPAEWIGQLPKKTKGSAKESPRAQRILSRLDESELKLVPDQHDAIDAVGIGLFVLGRLTPRSVLSNGCDG